MKDQTTQEVILGIAHAAYNVSDMEAALIFYREALGFEKAFDLPDYQGNPWIVYLHAGGNQFIELFYTAPGSPKQTGRVGSDHLCLLTSDIRRAANRIRAAGYPLDADVREGSDGNLQCWTHDPDGNRIEIMEMGEESLQTKYLRSI